MSTKIEWVRNPDGTPGKSWNPISGCSKVSAGCLNCYAERMDRRQMMPGRKDGFRPWTAQNAGYNVRLHPERLEQPLRWRKPRGVFIASMADLFHAQVPDGFLDQVFATMVLASQHQFQILTKRPLRMHSLLNSDRFREAVASAAYRRVSWPIPNVWLGISAEDQKTFDERSRWLLQTPAAKRFVSLEPLLGPIDTREPLEIDRLRGSAQWVHSGFKPSLDQIIVGGESGPGARPMNLAWIRSVIEQCRNAGVPCFVKQLGAMPYYEKEVGTAKGGSPVLMNLKDRKGADPSEWAVDLHVRELP